MSNIMQLWTRLQTWSKENAPGMLSELNPGATDEQLDKLEKSLGRILPDDYRDSLRIHNGEADGWPFRVFADMGSYHSCDALLEDRSAYLEIAEDQDDDFEDDDSDVVTVDGPVKPVIFHEAWIPIMNSNGDIYWALDFAPEAGGVDGQVIEVDIEGCSWRVVANSFGELMSKYVAALEAGEYEIDSEGLATKEPDDDDSETDAAIDEAYDAAPNIADLNAMEPGTEVDIVGMRVGDPKDKSPQLWIAKDGPVKLKGSLGKGNWDKVLRVRIKVGKRGEGPHELIDWEALG